MLDSSYISITEAGNVERSLETIDGPVIVVLLGVLILVFI